MIFKKNCFKVFFVVLKFYTCEILLIPRSTKHLPGYNIIKGAKLVYLLTTIQTNLKAQNVLKSLLANHLLLKKFLLNTKFYKKFFLIIQFLNEHNFYMTVILNCFRYIFQQVEIPLF